MTSFVVQTKPEAGAAPLHTCLRRRGKLLPGRGRQSTPEARSGSTSYLPRRVKSSTGVIAPFIVHTPEAGAAPLHCLRRRGKLLHGSHRAFHRPEHTGSRSGSIAHVSSKARQIAPQESSRQSSSRPHRKPERLHSTRVSHGAGNDTSMVAHAEGSALLVFMLGLLRGLLKFLLLLNEESFGIEIRFTAI